MIHARPTGPSLLAASLVIVASSAHAQVLPGHRLPEGPERPLRVRSVDIQHVALDLRFDMEAEEIAGTATISLTPLRAGLDAVSFDAARLDVRKVEVLPDGTPLDFRAERRSLRIDLGRKLAPGEAATVRVTYSGRPKTGMYFFPPRGSRAPQAWNYGEGGLHYGWVPLYNDVDDRFTAAIDVTVARPFVAVANGRLRETRENPDGTRTFRWVQEEPIPNYLLALNVGDLARVGLGSARVGEREVPLAAWVSPGDERAATHTFADTARMVEFFSERFGHPYPWAKYDQLALREFAVGAMETTTAVGFSESHLSLPGDPPDAGPAADEAYPTWTAQDTISHELAHHWFGDLVTCRSLGSIWLNESFASFAHTLWNGFARGEDELTYQRWRYLDRYVEYVRRTGRVRPMEYPRYEASEDVYQEETTYIKGALVLHMLSRVVGDEGFYRGLRDFLHRHAFRNADSADLEESLRGATGRNLASFFADWIVGGGGHPVFSVSYRFSPERGQVDLAVEQLQADQPFENDFRLPVEVEIVTASGARVHLIEVAGWSTKASLPADARPLAVVFDKGGWLVSEVKFERSLPETLYLLRHGALAERLRAARQLATDFPRRPETAPALGSVLADAEAHWGLRQEAAHDLGAVGGEPATTALAVALRDPDRRVRRAAAVALGRAGGARAPEALRRAIEADAAEDVVASAALSLGRSHAPGAREVLLRQLSRASRWWDVIRVGALSGLAELEDPALASTFAPWTDAAHNHDVRLAALEGWLRAAPEDPRLAVRLRELAGDRNRRVRAEALETLGKLHRADDLPMLKQIAADEDDPNLARVAREAVVEVESFVGKKGGPGEVKP